MFKPKRRALAEINLEEIDVSRDLCSLELIVNSDDQPMSTLQYEVFLKEWNPREIVFQVKFEYPLAISQDVLRDDFRLSIVDKSLFLTKTGLFEIDDEYNSVIFSFPR
jgi:hypothetical protein